MNYGWKLCFHLINKHESIFYHTVEVVCCWWLVYSLTWPESDWLDSGWVGLHTCGAWAIMAPQDKPAINTHTRGGATVMTIYHQLGEYQHPVQHLPVSCVGGAQGKPLRWRVEEQPCHTYIEIFLNLWTVNYKLKRLCYVICLSKTMQLHLCKHTWILHWSKMRHPSKP